MTCDSCKLLYHDLVVFNNQAVSASPGHKDKWTEPSSNRPIKYLSSSSQVTRVVKGTRDRKRLRKALLKFEEDHLDIGLTEEQSDEMTQLVMAVQEKGQKELEAIIEEAESANESY